MTDLYRDEASPAQRARRALRALGCGPAELAALALLATGAVAALGLLYMAARPGTEPVEAPVIGEAADGGPTGEAYHHEEELVVHVAGEVAEPGLYRLPAGARVADALEEAGGPGPDASLDVLNLARPLTDGEQLVVPGPGPPEGAPHAGAHDEHGGAAPSAWRDDDTLDINAADASDLEELPGIGPVLAERIVAHREDIGRFSDTGELRDVPGIGEKTFQNIADQVTV